MRACVRVCVCACVPTCMHVCMRACVHACRQHPRLSRAKFHFRDCGSLCRWPQGGMRPVKMVLRPQVCVCVIECRVAHVETRLPIAFLQSTLQKVVKRGHFFEKVAEQGLSGHCRADHEPPRRQKWVTSLNNALCSWGHPSYPGNPLPSKPKGKSVILCSIEPWMLSACVHFVASQRMQ